MKKEKMFRRHVLQAVTAYKQLLDIYCRNGYSTERLAAQLGISRNVLQRGFKKLFGQTIRDYKLRIRMERSRELFDAGKNVKSVAQALNYTTVRAFTTAFKKQVGYSPTILCNLLG